MVVPSRCRFEIQESVCRSALFAASVPHISIRNFLYAEDAARAFDFVLHKGTTGDIYNIGSPNEISNVEVACGVGVRVWSAHFEGCEDDNVSLKAKRGFKFPHSRVRRFWKCVSSAATEGSRGWRMTNGVLASFYIT